MNMVDEEVMAAAQTVWDFMQCHEPPAPADIILCLGSNDTQVPVHAAKLWHKGLAPIVVMSGGIAHLHDLAATGWTQSEARVFADAALAHGVPASAIVLEDQATNTGENFRLSRPLAEATLGRRIETAIVVSRPHMMRRGRATGGIEWPDVRLNSQAEAIALPAYLERWGDDAVRTLNLMVGDFQRVVEYPKRGFQTAQAIPQDVMIAFENLVAAGLDRHLLRH